MNAVEIDEAVSTLAEQPFDGAEFPFAFLTAFGNKETTVRRLRAGSGNTSDIERGVLQRNNIHLAVAAPGRVGEALAALRASPKTAAGKVKFILATDGDMLEAEDLTSGEVVACPYPQLPDHFGVFLPLAGISSVGPIKNNPIDVKATGRLNRLYIELLKDNPNWDTAGRRHDLNQFMARLIFCFFAEDTGIFPDQMFTDTVERMSETRSANTHAVIGELFRAMNTSDADRPVVSLTRWASAFPYVNGGLYEGNTDCPRFSRAARAYLRKAAELDWKEINPDIFGSMIQAVADDDERGDLGMHYTSVPNILKVLNPLFLDDLREQLEAAGDNVRKLKNLRRRLAAIRVFDPACGSGNFLVIAYKEMREIEAVIVRRIDDTPRSWIKLDNFYGIEIKSFAAEIARLALLIAEFQCDVRLISQRDAKLHVLPLHKTGQIHIGNALRMSWLGVCPPMTGTVVEEHDLAGPTGRLLLDGDADDPTGEPETYICGNPPYRGSQWQTPAQKADLEVAVNGRLTSTGSLDYVAGWFFKARDYIAEAGGRSAFVTTNSLNQGRQIGTVWANILTDDFAILFAHPSFKWTNLAKANAGVTVSVVGLGKADRGPRYLYSDDTRQTVQNLSAYLVPGPNVFVEGRSSPISDLPEMTFGSMPNDGGGLLLNFTEADVAINHDGVDPLFIRPFLGSEEFINGIERRCVWVGDSEYATAKANAVLEKRFETIRSMRAASRRPTTAALAATPYRFGEVRQRGDERTIVVSRVSSETRDFLPVGLVGGGTIIGDRNFALFDAPSWTLALIASRLHWVWIGTVCVRMRTDFSYSNTLGWNTFPVPPLTERNKADLTVCADEILLAREAHFPATIADLYNPENMPADVRAAHERNDETLERIYIGRRFRNDTERLEKLFELYTKMSAAPVRTGALRTKRTTEVQ
jgi:hypothetical protein